MEVALTPELEAFVRQQAQAAGYSEPAAYVRELLMREKLRQPEVRRVIDRKLHAALASGAARPLAEDWQDQVRSAAGGRGARP